MTGIEFFQFVKQLQNRVEEKIQKGELDPDNIHQMQEFIMKEWEQVHAKMVGNKNGLSMDQVMSALSQDDWVRISDREPAVGEVCEIKIKSVFVGNGKFSDLEGVKYWRPAATEIPEERKQ